MLLTLNHIVKVEDYTKSTKDKRYKVTAVVASYIGEDNQEYRKKFEAKGYPVIPQEGTHEQLNALRLQFNYSR